MAIRMRNTATHDSTSDSDVIQECAQAVAEALGKNDFARARGLVQGMPAPDLADVIDLLSADGFDRLGERDARLSYAEGNEEAVQNEEEALAA